MVMTITSMTVLTTTILRTFATRSIHSVKRDVCPSGTNRYYLLRLTLFG